MRLKFWPILFPVLVLLLSLFAVLPLFHPGFFPMHDDTQPTRVYEMAKSLQDGVFPVRWVADLGYGYGYPIFNFYGPLPYYIGAFFVLLGFHAITATKILFALGILLSGISMYLLSRKFFGQVAGLLSSLVYMYFPYHAVNIYVRGAVGEFWAYAFMPFVFLGLFSLLDLPDKKKNYKEALLPFLYISLGLCGVVVSHNLSAFMLLVVLVPVEIVLIFFTQHKKDFFIISTLGFAAGLLLSSFYVLPVFSEMKYTNVSSQIGGGADFKDHFVCVSQFWDSPWGFGGSTKGCVDGFSFKLGKLNIILVLFSFVMMLYAFFTKKYKKQLKIAFVSMVILLVSLFLALDMSLFVWRQIPFMAYLQYPWRFINFTGLAMSILIGFLSYCLLPASKKVFLPVVILCAFILLITSVGVFSPQKYLPVSDSYYTLPANITYRISKISDEYMPQNFVKPKNQEAVPTQKVPALYPGIQELYSKTGYLKVGYVLTQPELVPLNIAYFPAWNAYVNGKKIVVQDNPHGTVSVLLPEGQNVLELKFEQTMVEKIGNTLTIVTFFILLVGIIKVTFKTREKA